MTDQNRVKCEACNNDVLVVNGELAAHDKVSGMTMQALGQLERNLSAGELADAECDGSGDPVTSPKEAAQGERPAVPPYLREYDALLLRYAEQLLGAMGKPRDPDLIDHIEEVFAETPVSVEQLQAEITRLRNRGDIWKAKAFEMEEARDALLAERQEKNTFTLPMKEFEDLLRRLDEPARIIPGLHKLMTDPKVRGLFRSFVPRDPDRIDEVLAEVERIWRAHPDLRLTQLVANVLPGDNPHYNVEDDVLLESLRRVYP